MDKCPYSVKVWNIIMASSNPNQISKSGGVGRTLRITRFGLSEESTGEVSPALQRPEDPESLYTKYESAANAFAATVSGFPNEGGMESVIDSYEAMLEAALNLEKHPNEEYFVAANSVAGVLQSLPSRKKLPKEVKQYLHQQLCELES